MPASPLAPSNLQSSRKSATVVKPSIRSPYARPPGLPHPPVNANPLSATEVEPERPAPTYLSFLLMCLEPSIKSPDREVMARMIISTHDLEQLLHLAENICLSGCESRPDHFGSKQELNLSCYPSRYCPAGSVPSIQSQYHEETQKVEHAALLAAELYQQFLMVKGEKIAQTFAWNIREVALMQFIHCWDCVSLRKSHSNMPADPYLT